MKRALAAIGVSLLAGCAPDPVIVELGFPSTSAFLQSTQARILVFPLTTEELGICPELLHQLAASRFPIDPIYDSQPVDVCDVRAGLGLPDVGAGPHAYLVEVRNESTLILQGCSVAEVYVGAGTIPIELQPTEGFDPTPVAGTPDARCGGGG